MSVPVQITIRGVPEAGRAQKTIRHHAERLTHYYDRIVACHVVVAAAAGRRRGYNVRLRLEVPGEELVVTHDSSERLDVAIHDSFDSARRRLSHHADLKKRPRISPLMRRRASGAIA